MNEIVSGVGVVEERRLCEKRSFAQSTLVQIVASAVIHDLKHIERYEHF